MYEDAEIYWPAGVLVGTAVIAATAAADEPAARGK
jgi:hypothetical protein